MSIVTLHHSLKATLATDQLVFSSDEIAALQSAVAHADALAELHQTEATLLDKAKEEAHQAGYQAGHDEGLAAARDDLRAGEIQRQLTLENEKQGIRDSAASLALDIVRKIAKGVGDDAMLASLATSAASELMPEQIAVLKVHPSQATSVTERLESFGQPMRFARVIADATLDIDACIVETSEGTVLADMETHLAALARRFDAR